MYNAETMAKSKTSQKVFIGILAVVTAISLGGLTGILGGSPLPNGNPATENIDSSQVVGATGVPCLTSEKFHLHPHLTILVDGEEVPVPANVGVFSDCTQELHTHEADGIIHVESDRDKGYTFTNFLNVLGLVLEQPGYILRLTVDGKFNENNPNFVLEDGQEILLEYIAIPDFGVVEDEPQETIPEAE